MRKRILGMGAALVAAITVAACSSGGGTASGGNTGPIKIEVIAPFSGSQGYLGQPTLNGLQLALKDAGDTIAGRKVEFVKADDKCTPATAVQLVRQAASDPSIAAVFGPICSGSMAAVQNTLAQDKIVHVTNGYGATLTSVGDNYIFAGVANNKQQIAALQPYIAAQHATKAAIIQGDDGFSQQLAATEESVLNSMGLPVAYKGTFQDSTTDYSGQISGLQNSGAQLVLVAAYEANTGALVKQLRQEGVTAPIVSPNGCDPAVTSVVGGFGDKLGFALNFCPNYPQFAWFADAYQNEYKEVPDDAVAGAYTGGVALLRGLMASNGQGGDALRQAMSSLDYKSKLGELSYAPDGSLKSPAIVTGELAQGKPTFDPAAH